MAAILILFEPGRFVVQPVAGEWYTPWIQMKENASGPSTSAKPRVNRLYAAIWRWHFYAAFLVVPFLVIQGITGSVYLFKPQLDPLGDPRQVGEHDQRLVERVGLGVRTGECRLAQVFEATKQD